MSSEAQGGQAHEEQAGELRRLRRSPRSRLVAGVCGGLAEYFGLHPAIYRVIFVALTIAGGTGLLLYAAAALVMPVEGSDESLATQALREHRDRPWLVIGIALLVLGGIFVLSGPHVLWGAGGGIFNFLPVAQATDRFEELFATPHGLDLSHLAALCSARLSRPRTASELRACIREALGNGLHIVEVRTERTANVEKHRELQRIVAAALEGP